MNVQMVLRPVMLLLLPLLAIAAGPAPLTPQESAAGWRSLFDGKSLRGWTAPAKNWEARDGGITRTGAGGDLTYVMYRLPKDYELRVQWREGESGKWNAERIVCHGKVVERSVTGDSKKSRVDVGGCGEFLRFPDLGDAVSYSAIYLRWLPPPSSPSLFEEDMAA